MSEENLSNLLDEMKNEQKEKLEKKSFKISHFSIKKDGEYIFRIIPNIYDKKKNPFKQISCHWKYKNPKTDKYLPILCNKRCLLCKDDKKNKRVLFFAINKKNQYLIGNITEKLFILIYKEAIKEIKKGYNPFNLKNGCYIKISRQSQLKNGKKFVKYSVLILRNDKKNIRDKVLSHLKSFPNLTNGFKRYSDETIKKLIKFSKLSKKDQKKIYDSENDLDLSKVVDKEGL